MAIASVSANASDTSAVSGSGKAKSTSGNPFQELLDLLANLNPGQPLSGADLQKLTQLDGNSNQSKVAVTPEDGKNESLADNSSVSALTAVQISMLAALMQQNPQLQALLSGNINLQSLSEVTDILAKGGQPDWAQFNLPQDAQDILQQMATQPGQLTAMQKLLADMQNNAAGTDDLKDMVDFAKQLILPANNVAPTPEPIAQIQVTSVQAQVPVQISARPISIIELKSNDRSILSDADLSAANHIAQPSAAADLYNKFAAGDGADQNADAQNNAAADNKSTINDNFTVVIEKTVGNADAAPVDMLAAQAANSAAAMTAQLNSVASQPASQINLINASAAQSYNPMQAASLPPAVMQAAMQIQQNAQIANNNFMVQLHPAELGQIQVNLKFEGNRVVAKITADNPKTLAMMKEDSGVLRDALKSAGMETDAGSLEFSLSNSAQNMAQQQNKSSNSAFGTMLATNNTEETNAQSSTQANYIVAAGRVDVKL